MKLLIKSFIFIALLSILFLHPLNIFACSTSADCPDSQTCAISVSPSGGVTSTCVSNPGPGSYNCYKCAGSNPSYCTGNIQTDACGGISNCDACQGGGSIPTCSLTQNNTQSSLTLNNGDSVTYAITNSPSEPNAYWNGKNNGVTVSPVSVQNPYNTTSWSGTFTLTGPNSYERYVVLKDTGGNTVCTTNTVSLTVTSNPNGFHDPADCTQTGGWTCDVDNFSQALDVHLYKDGPAGSGTFLGVFSANQTRNDVASSCGGNANHGFSIPIPASLKDGNPHTLYAYAINIGNGSNVLLNNSPRTITCASPTCTIQGRLEVDTTETIPATSQTVTLDNGALTHTGSPYAFTGLTGANHIVSVTVPTGYTVGYTKCDNSTTCHSNTPTQVTVSGGSASLNFDCALGGYTDLYWHYTAPPTPVNGGWSVWGACSATCGGGTLTRTCNNPTPSNGGLECRRDLSDNTFTTPSNRTETISCNNQLCDCNSGISCGACGGAAANTCSNNGTQSCQYTTSSSGGSCNPVPALGRTCTYDNCSAGYQCISGSCQPNCNSTPVCSGACSAADNYCPSSAGTKSGCSYTTYSGGGTCTQTRIADQSCTKTYTCSSGYYCNFGSCLLYGPWIQTTNGDVHSNTNINTPGGP